MVAINLLNRTMANTKAAVVTVEIPVIVTATRDMVHSPATITIIINSVVTITAMMATGAMAAIGITVITKEAATGMTGIVLMAAIAGDVNTDAIAAFGDGSRNAMTIVFKNAPQSRGILVNIRTLFLSKAYKLDNFCSYVPGYGIVIYKKRSMRFQQ